VLRKRKHKTISTTSTTSGISLTYSCSGDISPMLFITIKKEQPVNKHGQMSISISYTDHYSDESLQPINSSGSDETNERL